MSDENPPYDLAAVRDLLLAAFTADDLRRLALYTSRPALKPLIHEFSPGDGLAAMAEKTTTFCHKQDCLAELLAEVKKANPRQYARFEGRLRAAGETAQPSTRPAPSPAKAPGGTTYVTHIRNARGVSIGDGARVIMTSGDEDGDGDEGDTDAQEP